MTIVRSHRRRRSTQDGAIAVAFIILVILLLGFVGLAMDVGRLYVSKAELQNAADACALAAAGALTGTNPNQLTAAEDYGIATGTRNLVGMQAVAATIARDDITFSATLGGSYGTSATVGGNALSMRYVRCTLREMGIRTMLLQVINAIPGESVVPSTVAASAVASLEPSISNCALPLAICKKPGSSSPYFGYSVGEWLIGRFEAGSSVVGKFKWIEFPGFERTPDLRDLILKGGQCDISGTHEVQPHTGAITSLVEAWNWRFGVKKGSDPPAGGFPPDLTGYAYTSTNWPSKANAYGDFAAKQFPAPPSLHIPWNGIPSLGGAWSASAPAVHAAGQKDRRLVVGPVVDCGPWDAGGHATQAILGWACYLLLNPVSNPNMDMQLEYRGSADDLKSGCVTSGSPGGPDAGGPKVPALVQ